MPDQPNSPPERWEMELNQWVATAPAEEAQVRQLVATEVRANHAANNAYLKLGPYLVTGRIGGPIQSVRPLTSLPPCLPANLTELDLREMSQLTALPPGALTHLTDLTVSSGTALTQLPAQLPAGLKKLMIVRSPELKVLPLLNAGLRKLTLDGVGVERLPELPDTLEELTLSNLHNLSELKLPRGLKQLTLINNTALTRLTGELPRLEHLKIEGSRNLPLSPEWLGNLESLATLELKDIAGPAQLKHLPKRLTKLKLDGLTQLTALGGLSALYYSMYGLTVRNCPALRSISGLASLTLMANSTVDLSGCTALTELSGVPKSATNLDLHGNRALTTLPDNAPYNARWNQVSLQVLNLQGCESLPTTLPRWVSQVHTTIMDARYDFESDFISNWYRRAKKTVPASEDWRAIRQEPGFNLIRPLIDRLAQLRGPDGNALAGPVVELLDAIQQASPESRQPIYQAASGASADCHARPLALLTRTLIEARASELTRIQAPTGAFIELARGALGLEWLTEMTAAVATHQWRNGRRHANRDQTGPNLEQEMHLELTLRGELAGELGLPFVPRDPYSVMSGVSGEDVAFARQWLQARINDDLSLPLLVQPVLKRHLEARFADDPGFKRLQASFDERMLALNDPGQMDHLMVERNLALEGWLKQKLVPELNAYYAQWAGRLREWIGTGAGGGLLAGVQSLRQRIEAHEDAGPRLAVDPLMRVEARLRGALQLSPARQAALAWTLAGTLPELEQVRPWLRPQGLGARLHAEHYTALNQALDGLLKMKVAAPDWASGLARWSLPAPDYDLVERLLDFRAGMDSGHAAPHAIAAVLQRPLHIRVQAAESVAILWETEIRTDIHGTTLPGEPIRLTLRQTADDAGNHYGYLDASGRPANVPGDGLCLFHAVLAAAPGLRASLGADLTPQAAAEALYGSAYAYLDQNLERYRAFVVNPSEKLLPWRDYRERHAPRFSRLAASAGATLRHAPQAIWLDTDSLTRRAGLCAGLARAWALAPQGGDTLLDNLFVAAAHPDNAAATDFRADVVALRQRGTALAGIDSWDGALTHLDASGGARALLVEVGNHTVALAAHGAGELRRYNLFEPNAGLWGGMTRQACRQALDEYFNPELRTHYAFDGRIRAFEPQPAAGDTRLEQAARRAQRALALSPEAGVPAAALAEADAAPQAKLRLTSRAQRALLVSGTGLRLFGAYRNLLSLRDNLHAGRGADAGIDGGSLLAEGAGEALERALPKLAPRLAQALTRLLPGAMGPALQTMARGLARGAGVVGNLVTLPFDLYSAIVNFSRAGHLDGLERQDALVSGSFASVGMVSGLALAGAAAAGAGVSTVGPVGLGIGLGLLLGMQIYAGVRQVQEIERTLTLSLAERFNEGMRGFLGLGESHATQLARVAEHYRQQLVPQVEADARQLLAAQPAVGAVLSAASRVSARELAGAGAHTHRHLLARGEFPRPDPAQTQQQLNSLANSVSFGSDGFSVMSAQAVLNGSNALASSPGPYEVYLEASDDTVDASAPGEVSRLSRRVGLASAARVTGGAGDDLLSLELPAEAPARHALIDGAAGENTLQLRLSLPASSRYAGFSLDLATGALALREEGGHAEQLAQVRNIDHLMVLRAAGDRTGAHHLHGDARANRLTGAGQDLLLGEDGDDLLWLSDDASGYGGSGADVIRMAGNSYADGGDGEDLYLVEPMRAGEHRQIADLGTELNTVYLAMPAAQLSTLRLTAGGQLELGFEGGAILELDECYDADGAVRAPRYQVLSQDGKALALDLPARAGAQTLAVRWQEAEEKLAALLPRLAPLPAQRAALAEPALLFNFGDGNDVLTGASDQPNRFVLGSGHKTATGGAHDDVLYLDATPANDSADVAEQQAVLREQQSQLGAWRYQFDGQSGNDTLVLATRFADSAWRGYRIDLHSGAFEAIARDGGALTSLGRVQGIEHLQALRVAGEEGRAHEWYGDAQANCLSGSGRDRLFGRDGDDLLQLAGSAHGDGGAGRDRYQIAAPGAHDRVTVTDEDDTGSEVELQFGLDALRAVRLGANGRDLVLEHVSGGTLTLHDARPAPGAAARFALGTQDGWQLTPQWPAGTETALALQLHHPLSGAGLVLGTEGDDRLPGAPGLLLFGGNGADRYLIDLDGDGAPVFIDNRADDHAVDTLELRSARPAESFELRRLGDDLALLRADGSAELRALALGYFNDARPHLALEIGGFSYRADELARLALEAEADDALPEASLARGGFERLTQALARFAPPSGAGETLHGHDAVSAPSGWFAAAA